MQLSEYRQLIKELPWLKQSAPTKPKAWTKRKAWNRLPEQLRQAILDFYGGQSELVVSREDVFRAADSCPFDPDRFLAATLLWGWPGGLRGKHEDAMVPSLDTLRNLLQDLRQDKSISEWERHFASNRLSGVGPATYTKLLYFMSVSVEGQQALILDSKVISVLRSRKFAELAELSSVSGDKWDRWYAKYLKIMCEQAASISARPDQLEMFVFMFGPILKG